jgi:prepilin-type N-terminal cleavage/methylation domain-containing protein
MSRRSGFTLIELVVVILILGILAGVAAPKFFNTSGTATDNGIKQTLSIVRDAIELYNAKNGALPGCTGTGADFQTNLATYMRGTFPASPVGLMNNLIKPVATPGTTADGTVTGWMYNTGTGVFICNCTTASTGGGPAYSTF